MTDKEEHTWQVTFPGNLRWTNATQIVKGMVPYGASNMAEIDNIRRRLNKRAKEADLDKAWKEEWEREADRVAAYGDKKTNGRSIARRCAATRAR